MLGIACEHGNILINYLIKKHPELLSVQRKKLRKVGDASNTTDIFFKKKIQRVKLTYKRMRELK